jgi:hypothetical protein
MNTTANLIAANLTAARCCDALEPCASCQSGRTRFASIRHAERVQELTLDHGPRIPQPRPPGTGLRARLLAI